MVETASIDLLNLLAVLTLAWIVGTFAERAGYPALMGELLAGIVFGPALLEVLHPAQELDILAELGVFLLMIYVGINYHRRSRRGLSVDSRSSRYFGGRKLVARVQRPRL